MEQSIDLRSKAPIEDDPQTDNQSLLDSMKEKEIRKRELTETYPKITKDDLLENFPFEPRGNQEETLGLIAEKLNDPKIRFVVIQAPTGTGKSPIGLSLAKSVRSAFILTSNRCLQDQY